MVNIQHQDENNQNVHYEDQYRAVRKSISAGKVKFKWPVMALLQESLCPVVRLNTLEQSLGTDCH